MMEIRFWWNSFIEIRGQSKRILCDPWINEIIPGYGWLPDKKYTYQNVQECIETSDVIYISHIHYDHFDVELLRSSLGRCDKQKVVVIPKLDNCHLSSKLASIIGDRAVVREMSPYSYLDVDDQLEICMIPQISEFTDNRIGIGYSMDSSLIIYDKINDSVFFNSVDNPLNAVDFKNVLSRTRYRHIDLLTLPCTSASEYPQAYLDINRSVQKRIVEDDLALRVSEVIRKIRPYHLIKAGGSYAVPEDYKELQHYIPRLANNDLMSICLNSPCTKYIPNQSDSQVVRLKGRDCFQVDLDHNFRCGNSLSSPSACDDTEVDLTGLEKMFAKAERNLLSSCQKANLNDVCKYNFYLYPGRPSIDSDSEYLRITELPIVILKCDLYSHYRDKSSCRESRKIETQRLDLHMSTRLFKYCLVRKISWNTALTSSSILINRQPNVFNPVHQQILNFLVY